MGGVQQIADRLAARLGRPVLVEDSLQRVVAYSEQNGPLDDIRRASILRRRTTPEIRDRLRALGVMAAREPLRTPGAPDLGLLPRVCVPARCRDRLLGFLWFIDAAPAMTDAEISVATEAAARVALALFHESLAADLSAQREREAVTTLLTDAPGASEAAALLIDAGCFPRGASVTVHVALPCGDASPDALEHGLLLLRRRLGGRAPLHLLRSGHGALLAAGPGLRAAGLQSAFDIPVTVGAGASRPHLAQASGSYGEALRAAEIASRIPGQGPAAEWPALGIYRWLSRLPATPPEAHPGLAALLASDPGLAHTLETYLDLAGNAQDVAARLRLHRSTLYHRLRRIERLTGADLANGEDRLALHIGLKLAHLSGSAAPEPG